MQLIVEGMGNSGGQISLYCLEIPMKNVEDLEVYQIASHLADGVWGLCIKWDYFSRDTVGKQLVKAADSIGANIAEGFGRFHYKDNIKFLYYARGSLEESRNWLTRANQRRLINSEEFQEFQEKIDKLGKKLNAHINSIKKCTSVPSDGFRVTND